MLPVGRVAYRQEEGIGERREQRSVVFCFVFWEKTRRGFQTQNSCPILTEGNLLSCDSRTLGACDALSEARIPEY